MHYFAHTRKACGPIALALVLSACGEETNLAEAQAGTQSAEGSLSLVAEQNFEALASRATSPAQSTVNEEFSTPLPATQGNLNSSQPGDGTINSESPNARPAPVGPVATRPARPVGDTLPVQPPVGSVTGDPSPSTPGTASGGDPMVTLIAKTSSGLNNNGTQLEWNAENVDQCQTSGAWQGAVANSGVHNLSHQESGEHTYMISCRGAQGTAMAMVTVTVESTSLAWEAPAQNTDGSALTDLAGYNLYYGTESGRYTEVRPVRDANKTELELPVEAGTYYLAMTAYDMAGNESELSNEIIRIIN